MARDPSEISASQPALPFESLNPAISERRLSCPPARRQQSVDKNVRAPIDEFEILHKGECANHCRSRKRHRQSIGLSQ